MIGSGYMTESLSEVRKMSGLGARGNYLLFNLRDRRTKSTIQGHENAGNLGAKLQSCHIQVMSEVL